MALVETLFYGPYYQIIFFFPIFSTLPDSAGCSQDKIIITEENLKKK